MHIPVDIHGALPHDLCKLSHDPCHMFQVTINKDEECLLLDNSEITKWKVSD